MAAELRRFVAGRLGLMIPTFLGITLLTFLVAHLAPGDPFQLDPENTSGAALTHAGGAPASHGLDAPLPLQYARWLSRVVRFDFGTSFVDQRPVLDKLLEALPRTLLISSLALLGAYGLAIPLGMWLTRRRSIATRAVSAALTATWSVPSFWLAVLLLLGLASPSGLELFPLQGLGEGGFAQTLAHLVLPVTCLCLPTLALATRQFSAALEAALRLDFIFAARARGLSEARVYWVHGLRNSLLPLVTMAGLSLPHLIGGSVVVERVFGIPGTGLLAFEAVGARDYPTVMGVATLMALATMLSMLLVDLLYGVIDPRIRLGGRP